MDEISKVWPEWHTVELLGKGGFGSVYKVEKEDFGQSYYAAVKVINYPQDDSERRELVSQGMDEQSIRNYFEENLQGLISEIQVMESLKTAGNIVSIEDYKLVEKDVEFGWMLYIRMELLKSLDSLLAEKGGFSEEETVKLGIDICSALECCEQSHTIHRDIKSANIFVNQYGDFKLGDFGISKQMESTMSVKSQKGTFMYMAPEIYRGESYDNTVDLYALGITLYRFLNYNRFPFMPPVSQNIRPGDSDRAMADRIGGKMMPNPANCDAELARIVKKACAFRPEERYAHAAEMKQDLEKWKIKKMYEDTFRGGVSEIELEKQEQQKWKQPERDKTAQNRAASQYYKGFADSVYEETYAAFEKKTNEKAEEPKNEAPKYQEFKYEEPIPVNGNHISGGGKSQEQKTEFTKSQNEVPKSEQIQVGKTKKSKRVKPSKVQLIMEIIYVVGAVASGAMATVWGPLLAITLPLVALLSDSGIFMVIGYVGNFLGCVMIFATYGTVIWSNPVGLLLGCFAIFIVPFWIMSTNGYSQKGK